MWIVECVCPHRSTPRSPHLPQEKLDGWELGGCISGGHNDEGWLLILWGMQDLQQRSGNLCPTLPPLEDHPAPVWQKALWKTLHLWCGKNPQPLYDPETVYNSITKEDKFSEEVREPVPWPMYYLVITLHLDACCEILEMLYSDLHGSIISDFRALLSLFS